MVFFSYSDTRLTGQVIQTGGNRQIILNCSVVGSYNKNNIKEFKFNDNPSYSCSKIRPPKYAHLLDDGTTCQLIIPKATKANFKNYRCRVKFQIQKTRYIRYCYLLSEITIHYENVFTTTPSEEPLMTTHSRAGRITTPEEIFINESDLPNTVETFLIVIGALLTVIVIVVATVIVIVIVIVVIATVYLRQRTRRQPRTEVYNIIYNPQLSAPLLNVIQPREGTYYTLG